MNKNFDERISKVTQVAEDVFWATVAAEFSEVKTGDLDPGMVKQLNEVMKLAITVWVKANHPEFQSESN